MNIKGFSTPIQNIEGKKSTQKTKTFESNKDRDPGSNQHFSQEDEQDKKFDRDEVEEAIKFMQNYSGIKDNNLTVSIQKINEVELVIIKDLSGKIVRRMQIIDLIHSVRALSKTSPDKRGGVFNKSA